MPEWKQEIRERLVSLHLAPAREADIVEELSQHLEDRYAELLAGGATEAEAYQRTLAELSESEIFVREMRSVERQVAPEPIVPGTNQRTNMIADLWQDLRYGARMLLKKPGFTALAALTLALGIGLVTIQFSFINGVMFKGLPFERSERIMLITRNDPEGKTSIPLTEFFTARERQKSFSKLAALDDREPLGISGEGIEARNYRGAGFSSDVLPLLGVQPVLGRAFAPVDERSDAPLVILLSYRAWQNDFGADPNIVGRPVRLSGAPATIIGVLPAGFAFPVAAEAWVNLRPPTSPSREGPGAGERADLLGRLNDHTTPAAARAEFEGFIRPTRAFTAGGPTQRSHVQIVPFFEAMGESSIRIVLLSLLAGASGVLALACLNVANLLSARALERGHELSIRSALGASRNRLVRQMLSESCLLAALGALGGVLLARWGVSLLDRGLNLSDGRPFWLNIEIDYRVLAATAGLTLVVGLLAGLFPALRATRVNIATMIKDSAGAATSVRLGRFNRGLVITQVGVSCAVLIATSVLVNVAQKAAAPALPFDPEAILSAQIEFRSLGDVGDQARLSFQLALLERLRALPGVKAATITASYPFQLAGSSQLEASGITTGDAKPLWGYINPVAAGFFRDLQVPLREGREFNDSDGPNSELAAIVSESLARRFWPGESALGKRIRRYSPNTASAQPSQSWMTVVGVAAELPLGSPRRRQGLHVPLSQRSSSHATVLLTTTHDPLLLIRPLREAVRALLPDVAVDRAQTLTERMEEDVRPFPAIGMLAFAFGVSGLILAAVGVYGVTSFAVRRRTREFGIRMALGAQPSDVLGLVFKQGAWQLALGLSIGAIVGFAISHPLMREMATLAEAPGVVVYLLVFASIAFAAACALGLPARRAAKVDPLVALRCE